MAGSGSLNSEIQWSSIVVDTTTGVKTSPIFSVMDTLARLAPLDDVSRMTERLMTTDPSLSTGRRRHRVMAGSGQVPDDAPRKLEITSRPPTGGLHALYFGGWYHVSDPSKSNTWTIKLGSALYERGQETRSFNTSDFTSRDAVTYAEDLCKKLPELPKMHLVTSTTGPGVIPASVNTWRGGASASLGTGAETLGVPFLAFRWHRVPVIRWAQIFRSSHDIPVPDAAGDMAAVDSSAEMFWATPMAGMFLLPYAVPGTTVNEVMDAIMCKGPSNKRQMSPSEFVSDLAMAIGDIPLAYSSRNRKASGVDTLFPYSFTDAGLVYNKRIARKGESVRVRRDGDRIFPIVLLPFLLLMDLSALERYRLQDALERFKSEIVDAGFGPSVMELVDRFGRTSTGELSDRRGPPRKHGDPNDRRNIAEAAAMVSENAFLEGIVALDLMRKSMQEDASTKKRKGSDGKEEVDEQRGRAISLFTDGHLYHMLDSIRDGSRQVKDASLRIVARGFTVNLEQSMRAFNISTATGRAFDASMGATVTKMAERIAFLERKLEMKEQEASSVCGCKPTASTQDANREAIVRLSGHQKRKRKTAVKKK